MHELAVTENILNIAIKYAEDANALKVTDLYLVIGSFASIVDESVQFYWEILTKDTICSGSKLHFKKIKAEMKCLDCEKTYKIKRQLEPCPKCNGIRVKLIKGDEFFLDSIEIQRNN